MRALYLKGSFFAFAAATLAACADDPLTGPARPRLDVAAPSADDVTEATWTFCDSASAPVWLAHQDGDGAWERVARSGGSAARDSVVYRFTAKGRGGVAVVTSTPNGEGEEGHELAVFYGSAAELAALGQAHCASGAPAGGKRLTGTVAGVDMMSQASVSFGQAYANVMGMEPSFSLQNVASGPQDLVASLSSFSFEGGSPSISLSKLIVRRGLDLADGAAIPALDFAGDEAFAPESAPLTVENAAGSRLAMSITYSTAGGASAALFAGLGGAQYYGVPKAKQEDGDLHSLMVMTAIFDDEGEGEDEGYLRAFSGANPLVAFSRDGEEAAAEGTRAVVTHFREAKERKVALGPELARPEVSEGREGAPRWRARVARQAEYDAALTVALSQGEGEREVTITTSAGYVGDAKAWEPSVPDLSAVDGFDAKWGLLADGATSWTVSGFGGDVNSLFGAAPKEGAAYRFAARSSEPTSLARRAQRGAARR